MPKLTNKEILEQELFIYDEEEYIKKFCTSIKDMVRYKSYVRLLPAEDYIVRKIATLILNAKKKEQRFNQEESLKILGDIIRYDRESPLKSLTIDILFELYKIYILYKDGRYSVYVNTFLINKKLKNEQIKWLVENWELSEHNINRLLRYPNNSPVIKNWSLDIYKNKEIQERKSELISKFINKKNYKSILKEENDEVIIWAVYYSNRDSKHKEFILNKIANKYEFNKDLIKVCSRLNFKSPIKTMLENN